MALVVSGTVISVMIANSNSPYCKIIITTSEGVSTETFESNQGSNPLIFMREDNQVWTGELEILLWNGDQGLAAKDYTGRRVNPYWGYTTGSGDESVVHAPYWVVDQEFIGFSGTSYLKLTCWSVWDIMGIKAVGGDAADAVPIFNASFDKSMATLVDDILDDVILKGFSGGISLTVPVGNLDTTTDFTTGIFKEYKPQIAVEWGQAVRQILRLIMDLTLCGLRMRDDAMHVLYPAVGDSDNYTFGTGGFTLISSNMHTSIAVPNRIIYADKVPDIGGANATHSGTANDSTSQGRVGIITQLYVPQAGADIGNNTGAISGNDEAQQRADTILASIQHEAAEGMITLRPHPGVEVWDKANIVDPISGVTTNGRVGRVESIWDATGLATPRTRYVQTIEFGGLTLRASNLSRYIDHGVEEIPTIPSVGVSAFVGVPSPVEVPDTERIFPRRPDEIPARAVTVASTLGLPSSVNIPRHSDLLPPSSIPQFLINAAQQQMDFFTELVRSGELKIEREISPETVASLSNFRSQSIFEASPEQVPDVRRRPAFLSRDFFSFALRDDE